METQTANVIGAPELATNQVWHVVSYLLGNATRKCPIKFDSFKTVQYIGRSGDFHHFIGDGRTILVCTIQFKP